MEEIINFDTAKLAKSKGLEIVADLWGEYTYYKSDGLRGKANKIGYQERYTYEKGELYPCVSQGMLQKWLRDNHAIEISPRATFGSTQSYVCFVNRDIIRDGELADMGEIGRNSGVLLDHKLYDTYEEALEEGLLEGLKLIKD